MADEAFALSPISARAAQPREEDYDAISEAFMETSRGRWFLGEYAKRNRNADTRMVLDAVARIEHSIAAQKQPAPEPDDNGLAEALAAIRAAVGDARTSAIAALDGLALEEKLTPVRKGARIIREISWRWREIGADGRICDLLDAQVSAIEASCGQISSVDPKEALSAAFALIEGRIAEFGEDEALATETAEAAVSAPPPAPSEEMLAAIAETAQTAMETDSAEATMSAPAVAMAETVATAEVAKETPQVTEATAEAATGIAAATTGPIEATAVAATGVAEQTAEVVEATAEAVATMAEAAPDAAEPYDEAMLDMVAFEMGAPDPSDSDDLPPEEDPYDIQVAELPPAKPEIVAQSPEPMTAPPPPTAHQPTPEAPVEVSLGSSLLASGIVRKPAASMSDPLAPIRRMSQAEKVALFS